MKGMPPPQKCIAIDYDATYAADPKVWAEAIAILQSDGSYYVICATSRKDTPLNREILAQHLPPTVPIVFCEGYKRPATVKAGHYVSVWIDDVPEIIGGPGSVWIGMLESFWHWLSSPPRFRLGRR